MSWWGILWIVLALWALVALAITLLIVATHKERFWIGRLRNHRRGLRDIRIIDNLKQGLPPYGVDPERFEEAIDAELRVERADSFVLLVQLLFSVVGFIGLVLATLVMFVWLFFVFPFIVIKELSLGLWQGSIDWNYLNLFKEEEEEDDYLSGKKPDSERFALFMKDQRVLLQDKRSGALSLDWRSLGVPQERRDEAWHACEEIIDGCLAQFRREWEQVSSFDDFLVIQRWKGGGSSWKAPTRCRKEMDAAVERLVGARRRDMQ